MSPLPFGHPRRWLAAWSEGQLPEAERHRIATHLEGCASCRARRVQLGRGLEAARTLGPVPLPTGRRQQLERALSSATHDGEARAARPLRWAVAGVAAIVLLLWLGGRGGVELEEATAPTGRLEELALAAHGQLATGTRPLDLASQSPAAVRAWLGDRGLAAALAEARPVRDSRRYRLAGAADLSRPGLAAAAVLYRVDGAPLVLVAARQGEVPEAPRWSLLGKRVRHREVEGIDLLTWTNSGEAYALAATTRVESGCLLCHNDARRRRVVRHLALPGSGGPGGS
jgi:hypothetical protein